MGELELEKVEFAAVQLNAGDAKVTAVTDVAWADSQIVAAGRSNEEFASKIFSIAAPLRKSGYGDYLMGLLEHGPD